MAPSRRAITSSDDSEEESAGSDVGSDDAACNGGSANKRKNSRARQSARTKRQKVTDDSNDAGSPQPGPSGLSRPVSVNNGTEESSGEDTPDSDYMPVDDVTRNKKRPPKGKPPTKRVSPRKKKKDTNYAINTAKSQNGKLSRNSSNSSKKLSRLSQPSKDSAMLDPKHIESLAQKCVYFLLIEDHKKYAIRKKAIMTHVFKDEAYSSKLYQAVIFKTNSILMKTFGMELMELETQKDSYLLINILKRELGIEDYIELSKTKHQQHGLILYLLTIIFMNNNCITEDELEKALVPLRLDLTSKKPHPIFGDVKNYITKELVKQMYLSYECVCKEPLQYEIKWGLRAKQEVDKKDLLAFACKILDDTTPENWILQYKDAEESTALHPT